MGTTATITMQASAQHHPVTTPDSASTTINCAISNSQRYLRIPHRERRHKPDFVIYDDNSTTNVRRPLPQNKGTRVPLRDKTKLANAVMVPAYRRAATPFVFSAADPLWEDNENYMRDYITSGPTPPLHRIYETLPSTVSTRSRPSRRLRKLAPLHTPTSTPHHRTTRRQISTPKSPVVPISIPIRIAMHDQVNASSFNFTTSFTQPYILPAQRVHHPIIPSKPVTNSTSASLLAHNTTSPSTHPFIYEPAGDREFRPSIVSSPIGSVHEAPATYARGYP